MSGQTEVALHGGGNEPRGGGCSLLLIALICLSTGLNFYLMQRLVFGERVTTQLLSPDQKRRAVLIEMPNFLDRNFRVVIEEVIDSGWEQREIFRSPDEGRPVGTERFWWSDSGCLLLSGREFYVREQKVTIEGGDAAYLLYDTRDGRLWCNNDEMREHYEEFAEAELIACGFGELIPEQAASAR